MKRVSVTATQIRHIRTNSKARQTLKAPRVAQEPGPSHDEDTATFHNLHRNLSTPRQLVEHLNDYVIGQILAKKVLSVSLFNHYNRVRQNKAAEILDETGAVAHDYESDSEGSSIASARLHPHPIRSSTRSNALAAPLFEKSNVLIMGPSGSGKTLLVRTLAKILEVPFSISDATAFTQAGYVGDDADVCIQRLLQAANFDTQLASQGIVYIDEVDKLARRDGLGGSEGGSRDVSGEGVQQSLLKMMEGTVITVSGKGSTDSGDGRPKSQAKEHYHVDTSNVLFIFSGAFVGLEKIISRRVAKGSIGFTAPMKNEKQEADPFNKYFTPLESDNIFDRTLPQDLVQYGFIPEFISRLPSMTALNPLSKADLHQILTSVKGSLVGQYTAQFLLMGVEIRFTTGAIRAICDQAFDRGGGARGLRGIMEKLLLEPMYECPGSNIQYVLITEETVRGDGPVGYWAKGHVRDFVDALSAEESRYPSPTGSKINLKSASSKILGATHGRTDTRTL